MGIESRFSLVKSVDPQQLLDEIFNARAGIRYIEELENLEPIKEIPERDLQGSNWLTTDIIESECGKWNYQIPQIHQLGNNIVLRHSVEHGGGIPPHYPIGFVYKSILTERLKLYEAVKKIIGEADYSFVYPVGEAEYPGMWLRLSSSHIQIGDAFRVSYKQSS